MRKGYRRIVVHDLEYDYRIGKSGAKIYLGKTGHYVNFPKLINSSWEVLDEIQFEVGPGDIAAYIDQNVNVFKKDENG